MPVDVDGIEGRGQNLKAHRWKKGQSGNPAGRPKSSISINQYVQSLTWAIHHKEKDKQNGKTNIQVLLELLWEKGTSGESVAWTRELLNRVLGKPKEHIELDTKGDLNLQFAIISASDLQKVKDAQDKESY